MAYPTDCLTASTALDIANRNANILVGNVTFTVARRAAYADTVGGGTLDNASEVIRTAVQEHAVPSLSMTRPAFVNAIDACGTGGGIDVVGSTEYQIQLQNARGRGPKVCVKTTRTGFASSYAAAENSLQQMLTNVTNADIRAVYLDHGGSKAVIDSAGTFAQDFAGDVNHIDQAFPARTPDTQVTAHSLQIIMTYMRETLGVMPIDMGGVQEGVFKFIGSQDVIQAFRDELNVGLDLRALTTGQYSMGADAIKSYGWSGPYHGVMFGVDPLPLRASTTNMTSGLVEPGVSVATSVGHGYRPNSSWVSAQYELGFLMGQMPFKRLVPSYARVPGWNFPAQIANGGLQFKILKDADCNLFEDFGQHIYEIERAYQPVHPESVCAILYKRTLNLAGWSNATT